MGLCVWGTLGWFVWPQVGLVGWFCDFAWVLRCYVGFGVCGLIVSGCAEFGWTLWVVGIGGFLGLPV